jgi:hypothetical protein
MDTLDPTNISQLTQVISHVIAPSFLLGAVTALVSLVFARMGSVVDRLRELNAIPETNETRAWLREDLPRQRRLLGLLKVAAVLSLASGVMTALLIILAFALAILDHDHAHGMALLFMVAMALFIAASVVMAVVAVTSVTEFDHHHAR